MLLCISFLFFVVVVVVVVVVVFNWDSLHARLNSELQEKETQKD